MHNDLVYMNIFDRARPAAQHLCEEAHTLGSLAISEISSGLKKSRPHFANRSKSIHFYMSATAFSGAERIISRPDHSCQSMID